MSVSMILWIFAYWCFIQCVPGEAVDANKVSRNEHKLPESGRETERIVRAAEDELNNNDEPNDGGGDDDDHGDEEDDGRYNFQDNSDDDHDYAGDDDDEDDDGDDEGNDVTDEDEGQNENLDEENDFSAKSKQPSMDSAELKSGQQKNREHVQAYPVNETMTKKQENGDFPGIIRGWVKKRYSDFKCIAADVLAISLFLFIIYLVMKGLVPVGPVRKKVGNTKRTEVAQQIKKASLTKETSGDQPLLPRGSSDDRSPFASQFPK